MHRKEIISQTGLTLEFYDRGCFNRKLDILQSKTGCQLTKILLQYLG